MIALYLAVYTVAAFGAAYVFGHSAISFPLRRRLAPPQVAKCPLCGDEMAPRFEGAVCNGPCDEKHHEDRMMILYQPHNWRFWLVTLVECPACLGFWFGLASGLVYWPSAFSGLAGAFYTAGANFLLARATGLMGDPGEEEGL